MSSNNDPITHADENECEDGNRNESCHPNNPHDAIPTATTVPLDCRYWPAQPDRCIHEDFAGAGSVVGNFPYIDSASELFSGGTIDDGGLQAYMDSILSNKWNDWN